MPIRFIRVGLEHAESEGKSMIMDFRCWTTQRFNPEVWILWKRECVDLSKLSICISELQTFNLDAVIVEELKFSMLNRSQPLAMRIQCTH